MAELGRKYFPLGQTSPFFLSPGPKKDKNSRFVIDNDEPYGYYCSYIALVRTQFCKKPLSCRSTAFLFSWACAISLMESPREASWRIIQTWASRIAVEAAPGRFPASARSTRCQWRRAYAWKVVWSRGKEDRAVYAKNSRRPCGVHGQKDFCTENKKERSRKK